MKVRLLVALVAASLSVVGGGQIAAATGDVYSCPAGTVHDYKVEPLDGYTFTVPTPPAGWTVTGVVLKVGGQGGGTHITFAPVTPGQVLDVSNQQYEISHAHVCKGRTPTTTTTSTTEATTTTTEATTTIPEETTTTWVDTTSTTITTTSTAPSSTSPSSTSTTSPATTAPATAPTSSSSTSAVVPTTLVGTGTAPTTVGPTTSTPTATTPIPALPVTGGNATMAAIAAVALLVGVGLVLAARRRAA